MTTPSTPAAATAPRALADTPILYYKKPPASQVHVTDIDPSVPADLAHFPTKQRVLNQYATGMYYEHVQLVVRGLYESALPAKAEAHVSRLVAAGEAVLHQVSSCEFELLESGSWVRKEISAGHVSVAGGTAQEAFTTFVARWEKSCSARKILVSDDGTVAANAMVSSEPVLFPLIKSDMDRTREPNRCGYLLRTGKSLWSLLAARSEVDCAPDATLALDYDCEEYRPNTVVGAMSGFGELLSRAARPKRVLPGEPHPGTGWAAVERYTPAHTDKHVELRKKTTVVRKK